MHAKVTRVRIPVSVPTRFRRIWKEKYFFARNTLKLNNLSAKESANRTIQAILNTEKEVS